MQLDQKTIIALIIGIIIGGAAIGLLDANRPKPIFSSASSGIGVRTPGTVKGDQDCSVLYDTIANINEIIAGMNAEYQADAIAQLKETIGELNVRREQIGCAPALNQ